MSGTITPQCVDALNPAVAFDLGIPGFALEQPLHICAFSLPLPVGRVDDMRSRVQAILSAVLAAAFVRLAKSALKTEARQA